MDSELMIQSLCKEGNLMKQGYEQKLNQLSLNIDLFVESQRKLQGKIRDLEAKVQQLEIDNGEIDELRRQLFL